MSAPDETTAPRRTPGPDRLAWVVLAAAVAQIVAPVVTINGPGASPGSGSGPDLLITPVGWAFSIWGVIYTLAIVQAVSTMVKRDRRVPLRLQVDQIGLYLGGTLWILMAALDSSPDKFLALALMFGVAGFSYEQLDVATDLSVEIALVGRGG